MKKKRQNKEYASVRRSVARNDDETLLRVELLQEYRLLSDLMKHIPDVIYFKDTSGKLIMVNDAHAKGLGLTPREVAGKTDFDIFPKDRAELMRKDDCYVMETGKPIIDKIERSTRADGVDNYVSTTKIPRYDEKGNVIGLIGITRDITRRMQLERLMQEKQEVEKKLEASLELNRVKSEFVSVVSHELRTPLAIIKEAVLLLADGVAGELNQKQKGILLKAKNNIERLKYIIEELLDISRIEAGNLTLHYSLVNMSELVRESSDSFKKLAQQKGIHLEYILPEKQVNTFLDHNRIHRVVSNLISNAIKFTEEGGIIQVELKVFEDRLRVGVMDTGIGIAAEDMPKLFNKFIQLSKISSIERKGLGLGLSIVRDLVESHGGEVWVESTRGVGSKFYFTLPRLVSSEVLDTRAKNKIDALLAKGFTLYFVNLVIAHYKELKRKMKIEPARLFAGLENTVQKTLNAYFRVRKEKPQIVLLDSSYGECSYLLPAASEDEADKVNKAILHRLTQYFLKHNLKNVFVNSGVMPFPKEGSDTSKQRFNANLKVKKIYIGTQIRKFERLEYKLDVQLVFPDDTRFSSSTVDISEGGISFYSSQALKTDTLVEAVVTFPREDEPLICKGRIAWVREISGVNRQYRIGVEFIHRSVKAKGTLSKYLQSF